MLCLTFDTDHMDEARMAEFLDKIDIPGIATIFCTQKFDCLETTRHEIGPHPTLEAGSAWQRELERARDVSPGARVAFPFLRF